VTASRIDSKRLLIIGAGGHGRSVAEAAQRSRSYEVTAFLDDAANRPQSVCGIPVWGSTAELESHRCKIDTVIVALGNNELREVLHARVKAAGLPLATVIHPAAIVSSHAVIEPGCTVMAGAVIGSMAHVAEGAIVNCGAVVDHDCRVEAFAHLGVNAAMSGSSVLGRGAWMKAGSSLGYGVHLPARAVMGPGDPAAVP
jgi:sugar O-acyltransferase (sialic acid O-acetyltransferase NeuD family)